MCKMLRKALLVLYTVVLAVVGGVLVGCGLLIEADPLGVLLAIVVSSAAIGWLLNNIYRRKGILYELVHWFFTHPE